jgi:uncharacterized protein (DUF2252 family)
MAAMHDLSREELFERGRARRKEVPRSSHASWEVPADARDPVALLEASNASRLPELVPVRNGRMLVSPFTYLRGSPAVMAADLANTPHSGIDVQLCGDAHLSNFGFYGSPERRLIFDLNDFDESLPGPWEWDVKRLATSVIVSARDAGFSEKTAVAASRETLRRYRETMGDLATMSPLDVWYAHIDSEVILANATAEGRRLTTKITNRARARDSMQALQKLTAIVDGARRIVEDPPIVERDPRGSRVLPELQGLFRQYSETLQPHRVHLLAQYRFVDAARKVVGVGSVGTRCWIVLVESVVDGSPLWLQLKEAQPSILVPHLKPSAYGNEGERVVRGQRLLQSVSDIFLGWSSTGGYDFYVRQLRDMKGSIDLTRVTAPVLVGYAGLCGRTLAGAHARTGPAAAIAGYLGSSDAFDRAVTTFALAYAAQNQHDYEALIEAERTGRIEALHGR